MAVGQGPELLSMAQQFTGLPMSDLIGQPLKAASEGNQMMAVAYTKFILETGFTYKDKKYTPIMLDMILTRSLITNEKGKDPKVSQFKTTFSLPLLTIIPLNSLAVDDVSIHFEMEVQSSFLDK
jgi:hypothetical protein